MILCMNLQSGRLRILVVTTRMNQKYSYMWQFFFYVDCAKFKSVHAHTGVFTYYGAYAFNNLLCLELCRHIVWV